MRNSSENVNNYERDLVDGNSRVASIRKSYHARKKELKGDEKRMALEDNHSMCIDTPGMLQLVSSLRFRQFCAVYLDQWVVRAPENWTSAGLVRKSKGLARS